MAGLFSVFYAQNVFSHREISCFSYEGGNPHKHWTKLRLSPKKFINNKNDVKPTVGFNFDRPSWQNAGHDK
jgi:hypothetical protein